MASRREGLQIHVGGKAAVALFALSLVGFVTESQLTQYVQTNLEYRQPYFIFYIVHSSFAIMLPLHLAFLAMTTRQYPRELWILLISALRQHLSPARIRPAEFPRRRFAWLLTFLTIGATMPGLLWFIAVSLAPVTDITALWNTNAFFAYLLSVRIFKLKWEPVRLAAVILATVGATVVVYGGSGSSPDAPEAASHAGANNRAPLAGDLLSLLASILYGVYQVLYKLYAALPTDPEELLDAEPPVDAYTRIPSDDELEEDVVAAVPEPSIVPPFGLYPNMLTSFIGLCTFLVLWIPIPILHILGISHFALPTSMGQILSIVGISLTGVMFNAGFMILLGIWGPIVTSVGSLLTIVMMFVSDIIFGGAAGTVTVWSLLGSGAIVIAFGVLAYDMVKRKHLPPGLHARQPSVAP
ncbi:hypothetical protein DAEQUDRAFT_716388 [Daedalea quercina L-15889]|uniref:EamA domain-containing protein n=1 Tax=Daedalea quercina L-15889 TaxID=1314783 RepID=A0A165MF59_9APHY|nr:hypothetical protein DAEQUDRAFT_716388 [Daedalea quercina L-15889]